MTITSTRVAEEERMPDIAYGIDFGTTNSAIAVLQGNRPQIIQLDEEGSFNLRSVLFFCENDLNVYVGNEAITEYIESGMSGRFVQSIKTILPSKWFTVTKMFEKYYEAEDLVALILRKLKTIADRAVGQNVTQLVIGKPARFSEEDELEQQAVQRLVKAARLAGFTEVHTQLEPIAAALFYEQSLTAPELVLVADLGGGTSDFTVMQLAPDHAAKKDRSNDILGSRGLYVGGDLLNSQIMRAKLLRFFGKGVKYQSTPGCWLELPAHIFEDLCVWSKMAFLRTDYYEQFLKQVRRTTDNPLPIRRLQTLIQHDLGYSLFQSIETLKCRLSEQAYDDLKFEEAGLEFRERVIRKEFEELIAEEIERVRECVMALLTEIAVAPGKISTVFMTGGTSQIPLIKRVLGDIFGQDKIRQGNVYGSVVSGLALSAPLFFKS